MIVTNLLIALHLLHYNNKLSAKIVDHSRKKTSGSSRCRLLQREEAKSLHVIDQLKQSESLDYRPIKLYLLGYSNSCLVF